MAEEDKGFPSLSEFQENAEKQVKELAVKVTDALDSAIKTTAKTVTSTTGKAHEEAEWAAGRARQIYDTGLAHMHSTEEQVFSLLKQGVAYAAEHKDASIAAGIGAALVLLPLPRRFLLRKTLGRFRSQELVYRSAELRNAQLAEKIEVQARELNKLQERLQLAQQEYERGLSKLKATSSELQSLTSRVQSTEKTARALVEDLRELPSKPALQMRADVAQKAAAAAGQRNAIYKMIKSLAKQGIA